MSRGSCYLGYGRTQVWICLVEGHPLCAVTAVKVMVERYEVELKLRLSDVLSAEHMLTKAGAEPLNSETQSDTYYDHPCRSFQETDEAVRIRCRTIHSGAEHAPAYPLVELTYKGPKVDAQTKTRTEYSTGVENMEEIGKILFSTGFKEVATVVKKRKFFRMDDIVISLDDVVNVGSFIEFESMATGMDEMKRTRAKVLSVVTELGFSPEDSIRESYLELYLKKNQQSSSS